MAFIKSAIELAVLMGGTYALATHSLDVSAAQTYVCDLVKTHMAATGGISLTTIIAVAKTWATINT